jgi:endo-1,4-beta-D-glucanase Y
VHATGGNGPTGGSSSLGGNSATGGAASTGGSLATGGGTSSGGAKSSGGTANSGGAVGGASTVGGSSSMGGTSPTGGSTSTGGATAVDAGVASQYFGFQPVPNSQNTANFNSSTWYTSWKSKFYVDCGGGLARIANGQGSGNTVSEGIGYGMLLAVGNDDKTAFAALWAYYKAHLDANGLMNWTINGCNATTPGQNDTYAATDGDEDSAMALVQADAKWGGYKTDATNLINLIKKYETAAGTPSYLRPGDAANNGGKGDGIVNPSYFATGYWHVWASYVGDSFWNQLATDAYTMLAAFQTLTISNSTGALVPDWGNAQGQNPYGSSYYYDACRTPWRIAVDYAWFGTLAAQTFLQHVSTYVDKQGGVASVPFDKNSAFLGPFALSGMAVSQTTAETYLNAWLSTNMDDTPYFQGSLRGLFLLLANHAFPRGF